MEPIIYSTDDHDIEPSHIDKDALFVIEKLKEAGFVAYLVGGSVRDLLTGRKPKDFDISTSAKPEEIKRIFKKSCLLIGRRFRLAHVRFGHKIIEVATFRAGDIEETDLITQDNTWGTPEEDAMRRDFTINGLFYDPREHAIIDYVGGWEDIKKKVLKTIGPPDARFQQDPVRMIRLLKFRARLGFELDKDVKKSLIACREEIIKSSPARVLEELLRMLESGSSAPFFRLMTDSGLLAYIIPSLHESLLKESGPAIYKLLNASDKVIQASTQNKPLDRAVLFSCLLFPIFEELVKKRALIEPSPHFGEILMLATTAIRETIESAFPRFPKRLSSLVHFILATQYRMVPVSGKPSYRSKIAQNKEFSLALDLLKIRAILDEKLTEPFISWKKLFQYQEKRTEKKHHHHHHHGREHHHHSKGRAK